MDFRWYQSDYSLFIRKTQTSTSIILPYVDDLLISENDLSTILSTKLNLQNSFNVIDLGVLKYFLGLEIAQTKNGLYVGQRKYSLNILKSSSYLDCKPTPDDGRFLPEDNDQQYTLLLGRVYDSAMLEAPDSRNHTLCLLMLL